jgi:hypothetical protein
VVEEALHERQHDAVGKYIISYLLIELYNESAQLQVHTSLNGYFLSILCIEYQNWLTWLLILTKLFFLERAQLTTKFIIFSHHFIYSTS